nr:alanine:cation symporter family protein [Microbacterium sp. NIBRBAC000506063]
MALIVGATSLFESSLAQLFKVREKGSFRGGPAYYIEKGLGKRWGGIVFAIALLICFPSPSTPCRRTRSREPSWASREARPRRRGSPSWSAAWSPRSPHW